MAAGITDSGLEHLSAFSGLTRLHADNPSIGNLGLQNLSCLTSLKHLVLFGASKVTSLGCVHLCMMERGACYLTFIAVQYVQPQADCVSEGQ